MEKRECIPVGCVPSVPVTVSGAWGSRPWGGMSTQGVSAQGASAQGRGCLPGGGCLPGWCKPPDPEADSPCGQREACENITFLQLVLWTINICMDIYNLGKKNFWRVSATDFFIFEMGHKSRVLKYQGVKNFTLVVRHLSGISDMCQRCIWYIWYAISGIYDISDMPSVVCLIYLICHQWYVWYDTPCPPSNYSPSPSAPASTLCHSLSFLIFAWLLCVWKINYQKHEQGKTILKY